MSFIEENEQQIPGFEDDVGRNQKEIEFISSAERITRQLLDLFPEEFHHVFSTDDNITQPSKEEQSVDELFPSGLRQSSENLRTFLKHYYRYVNSNQSPKNHSIFDNLYKQRDIDLSSEENLVKFFFEMVRDLRFKDEIKFDQRELLKQIHTLYSQKGTAEAFKNLVKIITGDYFVDAEQPWDNVLRPSLGDWEQEKFITVFHPCVPNIDETDTFYFVYTTEQGEDIVDPVPITVSRIEQIDFNTTRLFSVCCISTNGIQIGQKVRIVNETGSEICEGTIVNSPVAIEVIDPGKNWQVGQIVEFAGSETNTIARVESIDADTGIKRLEILEYGYSHQNFSSAFINPFDYTPISGKYNLQISNVDGSPAGLLYTLTVNETPIYTSDFVSGFRLGDYFLETYDLTDDFSSYNGNTLFSTETIPVKKDIPELETTINLEEWEASTARLEMAFGPVGILKGDWKSDVSKISEEEIRLEDNFYYQLFSYVVYSFANPSEYKDILQSIHPGGMKRFLDYEITERISEIPQIIELVYQFISNFNDFTNTEESLYQKILEKPETDSVEPTSLTTLDFIKLAPEGDGINALAEDEISRSQIDLGGGNTEFILNLGVSDLLSFFDDISISDNDDQIQVIDIEYDDGSYDSGQYSQTGRNLVIG